MTLAFRSTPFLLLFSLTSLMLTANLPKMAGVKLITAIQLWRKKKGWCEWKSEGREKETACWSHTPPEPPSQREGSFSEAMALLPRQAFPQESVHSVKVSQPACELGPLCTIKQVFVRQWVFHFGESEMRQALSSKVFLCKSHGTEVLLLSLYKYLEIIYVKPSFFMLKEIPNVYIHTVV